jgi:serine/threonine protein kinase/DNA-binding XRE family transcriptional regulator
MKSSASFGYWLRRRRKALDLTQEQLAQRVGCSAGMVRMIEADERRPSRQMAERLADCLALGLDERATFIKAARAELVPDQLASPLPARLALPESSQAGDRPHVHLKGYELLEQIGAGSFGMVYRAYQPGVGRAVAVKIILPEYANRLEFIRRFEAEAQRIALLEHPHIVPLYDYWRDPGGAYLVMRYLRGGNLQSALRAGPWSIDATIRLLEQVAAGLVYAHQHWIVHRDLKPANILLDEEGNAYLADFGIARDLGSSTGGGQPQPPTAIGSLVYLSPEQIRDERITPQTDIYSLGMLLYELLTGAHPFTILPQADIMRQHLHEPLPPLRLRRPDRPLGLGRPHPRLVGSRQRAAHPPLRRTHRQSQRRSLQSRRSHGPFGRRRYHPHSVGLGDRTSASSWKADRGDMQCGFQFRWADGHFRLARRHNWPLGYRSRQAGSIPSRARRLSASGSSDVG